MSSTQPTPPRAAFDLRQACVLACASDLAYKDPGVIEQTVLGMWKAQDFRYFEVDSTQCFIATTPTDICVSFRGTEATKISDWITDLNFELIPGPVGGLVHEGFYDALSDIWCLVDHAVSSFDDGKSKSLWVTGHSLGGALATLAVARWLDQGRPVAGMYTFGQPRTGDCEFSRNFDFRFKPYAFRVVNNNDIVTRVPPRLSGYRHIGRFRYLTGSGQLVGEISWWRMFLDRLNGEVEDILDWCSEGIQDHGMSIYRQLLESNFAREHAPRITDLATSRIHQPGPIQPRKRAA